MTSRSAVVVTLVLASGGILAAQSPDDTQLKQVIIFGRHAVRTPNMAAPTLNNFSVLAYPGFPPGLSAITPNGKTNETLLGGYFRLWLTQEKLLTGSDEADSAYVYLRADGAQLMMDTARAFAAGLLPAAQTALHTVAPPDPLFHPAAAGVSRLDENLAVAAVNGRLGGNPQALATAYAPEIALLRSVLLNYPPGTTPAPAAPAGKMDITAAPITVTAGSSTDLPINLGGLLTIGAALDPFFMEYADGLPLSEVGWGALNSGSISQMYRLYDRTLDLEYRTPYVASVQNSNLASHIARTMLQAATGDSFSGALGSPSDKVIGLIASNFNIAGFASLLSLDWLVPGYQPDVAAPGGALVFELRQSLTKGEFLVRAVYITQSMDQLRNRTPLTLAAPPSVVPVFLPGCSTRNATFDCPLNRFLTWIGRTVDAKSVDLNN